VEKMAINLVQGIVIWFATTAKDKATSPKIALKNEKPG